MAEKKDDKQQANPESGNVDQIREILFGGHLRAFDERFELVEARLAKETDALRKATDKRIRELEGLAAEIREEAGDRLEAEGNSRELALNKFELALGQSRAETDSGIAAMEERIATELAEVRNGVAALRKELSAALAKADREQKKAAERLDADKVARRDLAELLRDLAKNLYPEKSSRAK